MLTAGAGHGRSRRPRVQRCRFRPCCATARGAGTPQRTRHTWVCRQVGAQPPMQAERPVVACPSADAGSVLACLLQGQGTRAPRGWPHPTWERRCARGQCLTLCVRLGAPLLGSDVAAAQPRKPAVPSWLRAEMLKRGLAAGAPAGDHPASLLGHASSELTFLPRLARAPGGQRQRSAAGFTHVCLLTCDLSCCCAELLRLLCGSRCVVLLRGCAQCWCLRRVRVLVRSACQCGGHGCARSALRRCSAPPQRPGQPQARIAMTKRPHPAQRPAGSLRLRAAPGAAPAWQRAPVLRARAFLLHISPWPALCRGVQGGEPVLLHCLGVLLACAWLSWKRSGHLNRRNGARVCVGAPALVARGRHWQQLPGWGTGNGGVSRGHWQ